MNQLLTTALKFFDQGIATIPIQPHSKKATFSWKQYQFVAPTIENIHRWFANYDNLNIACLVGPISNNLTILDFDHPLPYIQLKDRFPALQETFTVMTSRGLHSYFFVDQLPAKSFKLEDTDIKVSGYCLTPPSFHPSGTQYTIWNDAPIQRIGSLSELGIQPPAPPPVVGNNVFNNCNIYGGTFIANQQQREVSVSEIKSRIPITKFFQPVKVGEDNRGFAHCPGKAHKNGDRDASLSLDLTSNRFKCISQPSCEFCLPHGGSVIDACMIIHNLTFKEAVRMLSDEL